MITSAAAQGHAPCYKLAHSEQAIALPKATRPLQSRVCCNFILTLIVLSVTICHQSGNVHAKTLPEIRLGAKNQVPACVTPDRLMLFLKARNRNLSRRFANIAEFYKRHGEAWQVRWDYAFFQMAIETNFLTYRQPNGRWGDVDPKQNNFAGLGTTGGGVPGDSFPDVSTGVLGQIQHLVAYSGEELAAPVAPRTALKQDHIIALSRKLQRPVRFSDLSRRWAVDPKYGASIEWVAGNFRRKYCRGVRRTIRSEGSKPPVRTVWSRAAVTAKAAKNRKQSERPHQRTLQAAAGGPSISQRSPIKQPTRVTVAAPSHPGTSSHPDAALSANKPGPASTPPRHTKKDGLPAVKEGGSPAPKFAMFTPPAWLATVAAAEASPTVEAPSRKQQLAAKFTRPPAGLGVRPTPCAIETVDLGPDRTVLLREDEAGSTRLIAVSVVGDFQESMTASFIATHAPLATPVGTFATQDAAIAQARSICGGR